MRIGTSVVAVYSMTRDTKDHRNKGDFRVGGKAILSLFSCAIIAACNLWVDLLAIGICAPPRTHIPHVLVGVIVVPPAGNNSCTTSWKLTVSKASKSKQKWRGQLGMMMPFFGLLEVDARPLTMSTKRRYLILSPVICLGTACTLTRLSY